MASLDLPYFLLSLASFVVIYYEQVFKNILFLTLEREEERKRGWGTVMWEGNTDYLSSVCAPGDQTHSPGMWPDGNWTGDLSICRWHSTHWVTRARTWTGFKQLFSLIHFYLSDSLATSSYPDFLVKFLKSSFLNSADMPGGPFLD